MPRSRLPAWPRTHLELSGKAPVIMFDDADVDAVVQGALGFGYDTAGQLSTLPIWMLTELVRPRQRPVTNVVAVFVIAVTLAPILIAYYLTRGTETIAGSDR